MAASEQRRKHVWYVCMVCVYLVSAGNNVASPLGGSGIFSSQGQQQGEYKVHNQPDTQKSALGAELSRFMVPRR